MKVALLGAGGALGARIVESFHLGDGPSLAAIARESSHLAAAARFPIDLRLADVFDVASLARSFAGCSAAVHVLPVDLVDLKRSTRAFCRAGTQARLRRLIYVSTADVYGLSPPPGTDEKTPLHLRHASAAVNAHVAADREFSAGCREFGLDGTILRPGLTYGARSSWFAGVIAEVQRGEVRLAGRGEGICNCVFLDRVVMAVRLALKPKTAPGPAFIITDDEPVTWREFYEALAREIEIPSMIHYLASGGDALPPETVQRHRCAWKLPSQRANQVLGLKPVVPFAEGLSRSVAWWRFAQGRVAA